MRSNIAAVQFKKYLDLPEDYKIDGVLCWGTSKQQEAINNLEKCLENTKLKSFSNSIMHSVREFKIDNKTFWFVMSYGGAELSEYLHLAGMFGSQKNILIGSCGGLYPEMKSGDIIIPTSSYGQESSVRMYNRQDNIQYPNIILSVLLKKTLSLNNMVWRGPIITCQGSLAETTEDIKQWSNEGYYGVDMETSTFFAVSNYFSVPSAAAIYVADNVINEQTPLSSDFSDQANIRQTKKDILIQTALEILTDAKSTK